MKVFSAAAAAWKTGRRAAFATVISVGGSAPRASGARMLVHSDGSTVGTIGGGAIEFAVIEECLRAIRIGRPHRFQADLTRDLGMCCGGQMEVFIEPLSAKEPITLYGAGHVAQATAPLLLALDFDVTVVDHREDWLTAERFPGCHLALTEPLEHAEAALHLPRQHVLIVTHDHAIDQALVERWIARPHHWLGMIGSQAKVARFLVRLTAAGVEQEALRRLRAPVGLDLGAETPAEIAVSIAAELIAVRRNQRGPALALSERPLKARGGDGRARPAAWTTPQRD